MKENDSSLVRASAECRRYHSWAVGPRPRDAKYMSEFFFSFHLCGPSLLDMSPKKIPIRHVTSLNIIC
jgi:hypothetical protein